MTAGAGEDKEPADPFVADFYPRLGEYLAAQHGAGTTPHPGGPASGPGLASTRRRTTPTRSGST